MGRQAKTRLVLPTPAAAGRRAREHELEAEVEQIHARRAAAGELRGEEAVAKQHERGWLTVRERIDRLADAESFFERGPLAGHAETGEHGNLTSFAPANYVLGLARVDGRRVVIESR